MINKNYNLKKITSPFPYLIIDNFFSGDFFSELEKYFPPSADFKINNVGRMHGDTTYGDDLYRELLEKSKAYNQLHDWVYSENFIKYFIDLFNINFNDQPDLMDDPNKFDIVSEPVEVGKVFNINNFQKDKSKPCLYSRLDLGYGIKNYGLNTGGRGPHIDNPQRLISILIYVGGFNKIIGGEHRIYKKTKNDLEICEVIKPLKNRLVASVQNNNAFHDVNPVLEIEGQRNAFYLAISSSKKIWKSCKINKINIKYNKNRVANNLFTKIYNKIIS